MQTQQSTESRGYLIEVSAGDFIDRYTIDQVRSEMLSNEPRAFDQNNKDLVFAGISKALGSNMYVVNALRTIHRQLWTLESQMRLPSRQLEFCQIAKEVMELNDQRHLIKAKIDLWVPSRIANPRIYEVK